VAGFWGRVILDLLEIVLDEEQDGDIMER